MCLVARICIPRVCSLSVSVCYLISSRHFPIAATLTDWSTTDALITPENAIRALINTKLLPVFDLYTSLPHFELMKKNQKPQTQCLNLAFAGSYQKMSGCPFTRFLVWQLLLQPLSFLHRMSLLRMPDTRLPSKQRARLFLPLTIEVWHPAVWNYAIGLINRIKLIWS